MCAIMSVLVISCFAVDFGKCVRVEYENNDILSKSPKESPIKSILSKAALEAMVDADENKEEDQLEREENLRLDAQKELESDEIISTTPATGDIATEGAEEKQKHNVSAGRARSTRSVTKSPLKKRTNGLSVSHTSRHGTHGSVKPAAARRRVLKPGKPAASQGGRGGGALNGSGVEETTESGATEDGGTSATAIAQKTHKTHVESEPSEEVTEHSAEDPQVKGWKWVEKWVTAAPDSE
eukprot:TRINITY_DN808_c0_g2_i1.p1 TRINITY_DN808_c0_g2~~TRINITY_DN808_c0_g2_i1.p1  ORF type:complete len:239 (-),score=31.65 TRINITY_DN808_c0_g2_i1:256-972(-)